MSLKVSTVAEVVKEDEKGKYLYTFHMPYGRPLQECYDAAQEVIKQIVEYSELLKEEQEKRAKQEESAQEEAPASAQ